MEPKDPFDLNYRSISVYICFSGNNRVKRVANARLPSCSSEN